MGGSKTSQEKCWINSNWWDREMEHIWGIEYFYNLERSVDITTQSNSKNKVRNPDKPATPPHLSLISQLQSFQTHNNNSFCSQTHLQFLFFSLIFYFHFILFFQFYSSHQSTTKPPTTLTHLKCIHNSF